MNKVYIVTVGYYEDYHIVGVFSTRDKAEEAIEDRNEFYRRCVKRDFKIEEWELDK